MNIGKTGKLPRWSKSFKKKLLREVEALGGNFDRVARLNEVEVSQLQKWQKRYEGEANNMAPSFLSVEVVAEEKALPSLRGEPTRLLHREASLEISFPSGLKLFCHRDLNPALLQEALSILRLPA